MDINIITMLCKTFDFSIGLLSYNLLTLFKKRLLKWLVFHQCMYCLTVSCDAEWKFYVTINCCTAQQPVTQLLMHFHVMHSTRFQLKAYRYQ